MMGNTNIFTLCSREQAINLRAVRISLEQPARYSFCLVVFRSSPFLSHPSPQRNRLDVEKWIEALDPLQAGSILSKEGMRTGTSGGSAMGGRRRSGSVLF